MRLIDVDELLKDANQHYDYMFDEYYVLVRDIENAPIIEPEQAIRNALTKDVAPIKHAFWKEQNPVWSDFDGYIFRLLTCSNCNSNFEVIEPAQKNYHYCPNCGAKMDFEEIIINDRFQEGEE